MPETQHVDVRVRAKPLHQRLLHLNIESNPTKVLIELNLCMQSNPVYSEIYCSLIISNLSI